MKFLWFFCLAGALFCCNRSQSVDTGAHVVNNVQCTHKVPCQGICSDPNAPGQVYVSYDEDAVKLNRQYGLASVGLWICFFMVPVWFRDKEVEQTSDGQK